MGTMCEVRIGGQEHEFLAIRVLSRQAHDSPVPDYWENNWLCCEVGVRAGEIRADMPCYFLTEDFPRLRDQLNDLYSGSACDAEFMTLEGQLEFRVAGEERGGMELFGHLSELGNGNRHRFLLQFDQSYLPQVLQDLERLIESFPVIGSCNPP
jgi:hypothetical protein